jgi:DNA-binding PadR family transcriptional regulator
MESLRAQGFEVKGATVYPHLNRLQEDGLIESAWHAPDNGPARKVMTITASGRDRLLVLRDDWIRFRDDIDTALSATAQGETE